MFNLDLEGSARIIEARLQPVKSPDFRLFMYAYYPLIPFRNAKGTNYFGKITNKAISDWLKKKTAGASIALKLTKMDDLERRTRAVDHLVVYYGPLSIKKFNIYLDVARDFID